ncbi:MAG TPA: DUF3810 domain-containing protein [Chitinophagaceae bacterium]|nr:DUF3810 domain-containing protein [Chitinophagaceae bacterium]
MNRRKALKVTLLVVLVILALTINFISNNKDWVEHNYSTKIYPGISQMFRTFFGWLPVSIGDLLYLAVGIYLTIKLIRFIYKLLKRKISLHSFFNSVGQLLILVLIIYVLFNVSWGLNYNRRGMAYQLKLDVKKYSIEELQLLDSLLLQRVNYSAEALGNLDIHQLKGREIFNRAKDAYVHLDGALPVIQYKRGSMKPAIWGSLGNYFGFLGYYNPFTGESQINTTIPKFMWPFVACHEIAHQVGYAKENEANFVGYLAARKSKDVLLHYSAYMDMFMYANFELYFRDSSTARKNFTKLHPRAKKDLREWRAFESKTKNIISPMIDKFYDVYLQVNSQPNGIRTYNEVTGWLIAYGRKFGVDAL